MKLTTIADLQTQDIKPVLEVIRGLGSHYLRFIENDLNGYRYEVSAGPESGRKPGVHASEVSGCSRRLVYGIGTTERIPDPTTTDANMRMRFRLGTAMHASIQDDLIRMCQAGPYVAPDGTAYTMLFEPEGHISPSLGGAAAEHNVQSSTDGTFQLFGPDGQLAIRFLLEIKTASSGEYDKLKEPKLEHIEQGHIYMGCLDVPLIWFLYYNKSNSNFTHPLPPFLLRFSDKLWKDLEIRIVHAAFMNDTQALPDRSESMACRWCPWSYTCKPAILSRKAPTPVSSAVTKRRLGAP